MTSEDRRTDEVSDAALARAARVGDREAFEAIVHRHGPSLYRYARRMLADDGDVQEVVQDAFVGAWRDFDSYRDQSSLRTWLFGIAAHKAIDRARKARAKPIDDRVLQTKPAGPGSDPHVHLSQAEFLQALERALAELPYRQRACWLPREVEEMSQVQIGRILGLSPGAVRGQLHRAKTNLAGRMVSWQ